MNQKRTAAVLIVMILAASGIAVLLLLQQPGAPSPLDIQSAYADDVLISEIHCNQTLTVDEEYFEIYLPESYVGQRIEGWYVTTFDDEGMLALPTVSNVEGENYIAIFSGAGEDDLDASDGSATIHLGLTERILDPSGDEIGIFDSNGHVLDYVRYGGGNGDQNFDGWPESEDGPSFPSNHTGSISLFGFDSANTSDWMASLLTPAKPNVFSFLAVETGYTLTIANGINQEFSFDGIDDTMLPGKGEKIDFYPKGGVDSDCLKDIAKHIAYSLEFYHKKGFTRGPATYKPGKINVTVIQGTRTETVGAASTKGHIIIRVGTIKSNADLKYVCEHELMHLFQFKTEKIGNDTVDHAPYANKFWIEGQATYWGIESTRANYNLTHKEIQDEFKRVKDHNWYTHFTDLNRSIFKGWGGSYSDYMGSYLFNKFIAEVFGEDKLKQIFDTAVDNFKNDSKDVSPKEAIAQVLGKSWEQIVAEFHAWLMTDAITDNGVPERKTHVNVTYNNDTVSDAVSVNAYSAAVQRIKVNSTQPFKIKFNVNPSNSKWKITIIYVYGDGSRKKMVNSPFDHGPSYPHIAVNPEGHDKELKEVIVIKSHVGDSTAKINMTVSPIPRPGPAQITPNGGPYDFELPWGLGNTTIWDYPWLVSWNFTYLLDLNNYTLRVNYTTITGGSAFNITIESPSGLLFEEPGVGGGEQILVNFDPEYFWEFGDYRITISQYNWTSMLSGTLELLEETREGAVFENPMSMVPDEEILLEPDRWRTDSCIWYELPLDPNFDYTLFLQVDGGFEIECDWYIEVYDREDPMNLLASNEGVYADGEWPRELLLPRYFEENYPSSGIALIRVVFSTSAPGASGYIIAFTQPIAGSSIDNPLWYNGETEYFGVPLPYSIHDDGSLYINATLEEGTAYWTYFNCSEPITGLVWNGEDWLEFSAIEGDNLFAVYYEAMTDIICFQFQVMPSPESILFYIFTEVFVPD